MFKNIFTAVHILCALCAGVVLLILLLSDATNTSSLSGLYWSRTTIDGAELQWTLYRLCITDSGTQQCTGRLFAYPYDPVENLKGTSSSDLSSSIPSSFTNDKNTYHYLSKASYGLFLAALIITVINWPISLCAVCNAGGFLSALVLGLSTMAFVVGSAAAATITAAHVKGRNAFAAAGFDTKLGTTNFALAWVSVAILLISFVLTCCIGGNKKYRRVETVYAQ